MPKMDGFMLADQIRQDPALADTWIIALTSGIRADDVERCEQTGIAAHLMKPVKQAELQNTLLSVLAAGGAAPRASRTTGPAEAPADKGRSLRILLVEDGLTNRKLAVGLLATAAATWVSLRLLPPGPGRVRYGALVRLTWRFLWQSVVAGIDVARLAFAPRLALRPGWLNYQVRIPPGPGRATFGALTSLVPGTLPVGAGPGDTLVYHCLDLSRPVAEGLAADEALLIEAQGGGHADD